jgi:tetratricopeptide (TPR) repeat protein
VSKSFDQFRAEVGAAIEDRRIEEVVTMMTDWLDSGGRADSRDGTIWFLHVYGSMLNLVGRTQEGLDNLENAYRMDSNNIDVTVGYGRQLFEADRLDEAVQVLRALTLKTNIKLSKPVQSSTYRIIGECHRRNGELNKARAAFDQALRSNPSDEEALDGMLKTIEGMDDAEKAVRSRKVLLKNLSDPAAKVMVLKRQGADLCNRMGDLKGALKAFDEAIRLAPGNVDLLRRKAVLLEALDETEAAAQILLDLANGHRDDPDLRCDFLEQALGILKESSELPGVRAEILEALLDLNPDRLEAFEELTIVCNEEEDWLGLVDAYRRMIKRHEKRSSPAARALPLLWRNLGELLAEQLEQPADAAEAMIMAAKMLPKDVEVLKRAIELCRLGGQHTQEALQLCRELWLLAPGDNATRRLFVELLIKAGQLDEALCVLRVLRVEKNWSDELEDAYCKLQRPTLILPQGVVSDSMRRRFLRPRKQSKVVDAVMAIGSVVLRRLFASDLSVHGVKEKDRVDFDKPLLFNRLYLDIAAGLELKDPPPVYLKLTMMGMANAVLERPAFVVGPDMMSGRSEREIAFILARLLTLTRPEYVLTTIQEPVHLRSILVALVNRTQSGIEVGTSGKMDVLTQEIDKRLKPDLDRHLREAVETMVRERLNANIDGWVESVADEANRTALLFCDDLDVAEQMISDLPGVLGPSNTQNRLKRLRAFGMSDPYFQLRSALKLSVQGT